MLSVPLYVSPEAKFMYVDVLYSDAMPSGCYSKTNVLFR